MKNIALFGITSNPPHYGHMNAIDQFIDKFDEIWVNVSYLHPFDKPQMQSYEHRLKMTQLILEEQKYTNVFLKQLDKECFEKNRTLPVYTFEVLQQLHGDKYTLILGQDNQSVLSKFKNYTYIVENFPIVYAQSKQAFHSTDIRVDILNNKDISYATGKSVAQYIKNNHLYKESNK